MRTKMLLFNKVSVVLFMVIVMAVAPGRVSGASAGSPQSALRKSPSDILTQTMNCETHGLNYLTTDPLKAQQYAREGYRLASVIGDDQIKARLARLLGSTFTMTGRYDSAEFYLSLAEHLAGKTHSDELRGSINLSFGTLLTRQKRNDEAMRRFITARSIFEKNGDRENLRRTLANIAGLFMYQHNYSQAEKYYLEARDISAALNNHSGLGQSYSGLVKISLEKQQTEKALEYALASVNEFNLSGEKAYESVALKELAGIYLEINQIGKAKDAGLQSLTIARDAGIARYIASALGILADIAYREGNYLKSTEFAIESLKTDSTDIETKTRLLVVMTNCNISLGKREQAKHFFERYRKEIDIQVDEKYRQSISEMEVQYETQKKELKIHQLQARKRFITQSAVSAVVILALIVIILIFTYKNIRTKKKLTEQRVVQLEQEKQLVATQSLLAGEETERQRLAGDLHDGLGGLLTGVKLKLSSLKENTIFTSENTEHFGQALDLLDKSIAEMRRVAHNLMPETLMHYGLRTALTDFTAQLTPAGNPGIRLSTFGDDLRYSRELEITVYRITQELVNNSLKHARASLIDVQLFTEADRICVQVIDDGTGFSAEADSPLCKGKGLQSIRDRITAFNGRFEILSEPGKGTESTLEFLIP